MRRMPHRRLVVATLQTQSQVTRSAGDPPVEVNVLAFQWSWRFTYTKVSGGRPLPAVVGTPDQVLVMVVPLGQPVRIRLSSADVVHSLFVDRALFKRPAIPGRTSSFGLTFDQPGEFWGRHAVYCGLAHADMVLKVRVLPPDQFQQWLDQQDAAGDQAQPR